MLNQSGLAYGSVTGDFYVTGYWISLSFVEIRNLKAREVVLGYDLSEEEEQILSRQMNLLLSYEKEGFEDIHLLDHDWQLWSKQQLVSSSSMFIRIEPPQTSYSL